MSNKYDFYLQHPRTQLFYKVFANYSSFVNTRCNVWWGFKVSRYVAWMFNLNRWVVITFSKIVFVSQSTFIILNFKTLDSTELVIAICITPVGFLGSVKAALGQLKSFKMLMKTFMDKIHIHNSYLRNKGCEYVKTKVIQVERFSRFTAYFLTIFYLMCCMSWVLDTTIYNIKNYHAIMNKTMNFHYYVYLWVPCDYKHSLKNCVYLQLISLYIGIFGTSAIATFDIINFLVIYHLVGHIYLLKYNLKSNWAPDFNEHQTKQFLVDNIKYHAFITRTFKEVQTAFGINVAANYIQNLIEDGLILYQLMMGNKENRVTYGLMIFVYLGSLVIMSVVLEEIRRQNDDLADHVYAIPWQKMSIANQKLVILLLGRTQPDLEFRAACGMKAGVQPALSIIKSIFSYYVMLKSRM